MEVRDFLCSINVLNELWYKKKPLSQEELAGIRAAFDMIDSNGDGTICIKELSFVVQQFGKELNEQELKDMVKKN